MGLNREFPSREPGLRAGRGVFQQSAREAQMGIAQYEGMTIDQLKERAEDVFGELPTTVESQMTELFGKVITYAKSGPDAAGVSDVDQLERDFHTQLRDLPQQQQQEVKPLITAGLTKARAWDGTGERPDRS
jgi:hypothetical protein